ncbi:helix-turn-helix transcriptional regulator [Candidatus Bipolaricaulota bacterium]|nr:helix-turn-helix transcriptional regulator [Candidatus Bipolaricaulota bacterium]MBS3792401.1 helix-turn-helix transcriptional regulator [Candidatus Bipolaricaulota bacterium]
MATRTDVLDKMVEIRKKLGWSMERTARYLDVSIATFQRWEYKKTEPNFENTLKIQNFIEEHEEKLN